MGFKMCIRDRLLDRLRGMYAFAIWDTKKKKLFAARDIFGIKPLYYAQMNDTLMFGSEIKSFLEHPKFDKVFNEEALGNYLSFQFVPTNETFFKGVFCLCLLYTSTAGNHKGHAPYGRVLCFGHHFPGFSG